MLAEDSSLIILQKILVHRISLLSVQNARVQAVEIYLQRPLSERQISSGLDIGLAFGDAANNTFANGTIISGFASIAGLNVLDLFFASINVTNIGLPDQGISGIFGSGFPLSAGVFPVLVNQVSSTTPQSGNVADTILQTMAKLGPLLPRLAQTGVLAEPMFTVSTGSELIMICYTFSSPGYR